MKLYSSRVPNTDPEPWLFISDQIFGEIRSAIDKGYHGVSGTYWVFSPRPEFDHVPVATEGANPILEYARGYWTDRLFTQSKVASLILSNWDMLLVVDNASPTQKRHACKVLERLARLEES